ncbi:hypothetical protein [Blattabacterium cuenoti]|uniref:hypothetical protein n=1 Tax=Blattabacterium cuenoti TaxID=1653831 RepID=UPI00163B6EE2|nr:hypothetical protein [Blattabacterium cuenoti]
MKNVNFFIITLFAFSSFVFSQDSDRKWLFKIGANDINYFPIQSPFKNFFSKNHNSFDPVISSIEIEHNFKYIGLYADASLGMVKNNKWRLDDGFFFKFGNGINFHLISKKIDPYLKLGIGIHKFNNYKGKKLIISDTKYFKTNKKTFFILDGGIGLNLWLVPNFGVNAQSTYNQVIARQSRDYLNFWKHNVGLIFSFGKKNEKKIDNLSSLTSSVDNKKISL